MIPLTKTHYTIYSYSFTTTASPSVTMSHTLAEQVAVEKVTENEYISKILPIRMGNSQPIAYGGCTTAIAVSAACETTPPNMSLYSVLGHFHGPASTNQKLQCTVTRTRDTRSFATRRVQVKQQQRDGKFRVCMELIADFHAEEPSAWNYSASPRADWTKPQDCLGMDDGVAKLVAQGGVTQAQGDEFKSSLKASNDLFDTRYCPNGVSGQNLSGAARNVVTTQDHKHLCGKTSGEWQKARHALKTTNENMAALAFLMDGGLSFLPLSHNNMWFDDITACSTLDFALRIFVPEVNLNGWHLRERDTSRGGSGRTYSEGKLWDEQGNMVASMSQQSIMRLRKGVDVSKL